MARRFETLETTEMIMLVDRVGLVQLVALDIPHLRKTLMQDYPNCMPVSGDLAAILYEALTGHSYIDYRLPKNPLRNSRDALQMMFRHAGNPQFSIALKAVMAMEQLRPMTGITEFDANGRIISSPTLANFERENSTPLARTHVHARATV